MFSPMEQSQRYRKAFLVKQLKCSVAYCGHSERVNDLMPPLVCLPPSVLDHTFPRSRAVLQRVSVALGNLQEKIEHNECKVLSTSTIGQFVETFEWQGVESYPILQAVYGLLVEGFFKSDQIYVKITTDSVTEFVLHPVPADSGDGGLVDFWREEIGKVYEIHKRHCGVDYCIGVACDFAFGNYPK